MTECCRPEISANLAERPNESLIACDCYVELGKCVKRPWWL